MLLLATFFPDSDNVQSGGEYNVFLVSIQYIPSIGAKKIIKYICIQHYEASKSLKFLVKT